MKTKTTVRLNQEEIFEIVKKELERRGYILLGDLKLDIENHVPADKMGCECPGKIKSISVEVDITIAETTARPKIPHWVKNREAYAIEPKKGHAVFLGENGYDSQLEEAKKVLKVGEQYKITGGYVAECTSGYQLEGYGEKNFNSVMFHADVSGVKIRKEWRE